MPWKIIKQESGDFCVYKHDADGKPVGDTLGCHATKNEALDQLRALYVNVKETYPGDEAFLSELEDKKATPAEPTPEKKPEPAKETVIAEVFSEFKGDFPDVPYAPGVNITELLQDDPKPMFITLPISREGEVSKNGLVHDAELGATLVRQITTDKPGGIMGHIREEERASAYPVSDVHWIGAIQTTGKDGKKITWAKGFIPKTKPEVREEYRIAKAKGSRAATSIYGKAFRELANGNERNWRARDFDLEQIDLAPFKRAAASGSGEFYITAEMSTPSTTGNVEITVVNTPEDKPMEKNQIIAELTVSDLPETLVKAIITEYEAKHQSEKQIAELTADRDEKAKRITVLETELAAKETIIAEYTASKFAALLDAKVAELIGWEAKNEDAKKKRDSLRTALRTSIVAELKGSTDTTKLAEVATTVWESTYKVLAEMARDQLAGPAALVRGNRPGQLNIAELEKPEAIAAAAAQFGL